VRHLRLHRYVLAVAVERLDEGGVLLGDVPAPHLARPGDLLVVGVQLLVEDQELADPGPAQDLVLDETPVHPLHLPLDQVVDLRLLGEIRVARIGNLPALRPVPDRGEIDVDQRRHVQPVRADAHGFFDVRRELELVLEILRREEGASARRPTSLARSTILRWPSWSMKPASPECTHPSSTVWRVA